MEESMSKRTQKPNGMLHHYLWTVLITVLACFILFWVGSIVKCEMLTVEHGREFLGFEEVSSASKFKILQYHSSHGSSDYARIYCVYTFENRQGYGTVHSFIKQDVMDETWTHYHWEATGWSTSGSADDVLIWPYIHLPRFAWQ